MYSQLRTTIATLRLSLAEIEDKERQLDSMIAQFKTQLRRLPRQVIYGRTGLDASLAAMGEIEERLADSVATRQRVLTIKKSAVEELRALELVGKVGEARRSLQILKQEWASLLGIQERLRKSNWQRSGDWSSTSLNTASKPNWQLLPVTKSKRGDRGLKKKDRGSDEILGLSDRRVMGGWPVSGIRA